MITQRFLLATLIACLLNCPAASAAEVPHTGRRLQLTTTSAVTVSLPVGEDLQAGQHLYRNAVGKWVALTNVQQKDGKLTFSLRPADLAAGRTTILLSKPDWLVLDDVSPPKVVAALLDGKKITWREDLELGWLDEAPKSFELHFADALNPIDPATLVVDLDGRQLPTAGSGVSFEIDPADKKKGRVVLDFTKMLVGPPRGTVRINIACDDFAVDEARLESSLAFTVTAAPEIESKAADATAPNGIRVFVDSIHKGYENVECLVDGELQTPGTTTYGGTWASAEGPDDHWVWFALPKRRQISGLEISWANFKDTFWAASHYDLMTWDGKRWQRAMRVQENPETRTSRHTFTPRQTDRVLIWVPAGGNHPGRPDLTWITEVKLLD